MTRRDKDEEREERISMEIVVDVYGPEEQAMGRSISSRQLRGNYGKLVYSWQSSQRL